MPPELPGHQSLTEIARRTGTHQRLVRQVCKFFDVRTRKHGPCTFVADEYVPFVIDRLREWVVWHQRFAAITRC